VFWCLELRGYIEKYICKGKYSIGSFHFYSSSTSHFGLSQKGATRLICMVISALGMSQLLDQLNLIEAIKEVGHIKVCLQISIYVFSFKDNAGCRSVY